jgi:hypothetical protein
MCICLPPCHRHPSRFGWGGGTSNKSPAAVGAGGRCLHGANKDGGERLTDCGSLAEEPGDRLERPLRRCQPYRPN